jgi:hypothetical protein
MYAPETRLLDWEQQLYGTYYDKCAQESFRWGERDRDCGLFAAGVVETVTGIHPCEHWIGRYDTEEGMRAFVTEGGGRTALVTDVLGPPLDNGRQYVKRADVCLFAQNVAAGVDEDGVVQVISEERLGVNDGPLIICKGMRGLARVPMSALIRAWPVGRVI